VIKWLMKLLGLNANTNIEKIKVKTKRKRITNDARDMVLFFYLSNSNDDAGLTQKEIAYMVGISPASVNRIIKKYKEINDV
jgi:DNA-directed RNA polymerase specialized sigma subunit